MARGLIGKKLGMTRLFDATTKEAIPVTVVQVGPCTVVQIKSVENDGYDGVQLGFEEQAANRVTKPIQGHCKKASDKLFRVLKEFSKPADDVKAGDVLTVDLFKDTAKVDVQGITKGRGFQGMVKRYNKARGDKTHGGHCYRIPGSIGNRTYPGKVWKQKRMPGHMGSATKTVQSLKVVKTDSEHNLLFVKGAIPGHKNGIVFVTAALKA